MRLGRRSALMTQVDWSHLAGEVLFSIGGADFTAPSSWGVFESPYEALGIGTPDLHGASLKWTTDGRLFVSMGPGLSMGAWTWTQPDGAAMFGWTTGIHTAPDAPNKPNYSLQFPEAADIHAYARAQITIVGDTTYDYGPMSYIYGAVRDYMEEPTLYSLNERIGAMGKRVMFRLDADGHVVIFYTWNDRFAPMSDAFMLAIGFEGTEVPQLRVPTLHGGYYTVRASRPMPGVWVPSRPVDTIYNGRGWWGEAHRLNSGRIATSTHSSKRLLSLNLWLDGPADKVNLEDHFLDHWAPMAHPGAKITFWPDWISRREFSRWRRAEGSDSEFWAEWPDVGSLSARPCRRAPIALSLTEAEG